MYPSQSLRNAALNADKKLATYYRAGDDLWMFTCWSKDFRDCGAHSVRGHELDSNIAALSEHYHIVRR